MKRNRAHILSSLSVTLIFINPSMDTVHWAVSSESHNAVYPKITNQNSLAS